MRRLSVTIREAAHRIAAIMRGALRFLGAAYLEWLNLPGIYMIVGTRGTRYIGSTVTTVRQRWQKHISDLQRNAHHNTPLQYAVNSGEGFFVIVLEWLPRNSPAWFVDQREQYWIEWAGLAAVNVPNSVHRTVH